MKLGIVTLVSDNYGNKYQNYAVEQLLLPYGTVETFAVKAETPATDVDNVSLWRKFAPGHIAEVLRCRLMGQFGINNTSRSLFGNVLYALRHKTELQRIRQERSKAFAAFQAEHLHVSEKLLDRENVLDEPWNGSFDCFFCGSDQIWNPTYATTSELMFLSFAKGRSVALAPSFGLSVLREDAKENYRKWLTYVSVLSVREKSGQSLIKELSGREAELLLDPTMALERSAWDALAKSPTCTLPKKYLLCYFLGRLDRAYREIIRSTAKRMGLEVVMLFDVESPAYYAFDPAQVLFCIQNADYILTDSFHGTVFSILYHKNFTVLNRNEGELDMSSRLVTLLDFFGLTERMGNTMNETITAEQWETADRLLAQERLHTRNYIETAIGKIAGNEATT